MTEGWTRADQAELNAILWFFLEAVYKHKAECAGCEYRARLYRHGWCPPLEDAWNAVERWITVRRMWSRAEHLRAVQRLYGDAIDVRPALDRQEDEAHNDPRLEDQ